jgi:hypothetical protein
MEHEVKTHVVKAYKAWKNPHVAFWDKFKEIAIEVGIIVFAVSLSIWLHSWSEHKHEQKQVKTFLLGLKKDLQEDVKDIKKINDFYNDATVVYTFLSKFENDRVPNLDTLNNAVPFINSNTFLRPHKSRFSGFSSAGKLFTIENDELVQAILNYYESTLPQMVSSESGWLSYHEELSDYLTDLGIDYDKTNEMHKAISTKKGKMFTQRLIPWPQLLERYQNVTNDANKIIAIINQMYPKEE